jgi:hypothetical protein
MSLRASFPTILHSLRSLEVHRRNSIAHLARRKSGVQIPSPQPREKLSSPARRVPPAGPRGTRSPSGQQMGSNRQQDGGPTVTKMSARFNDPHETTWLPAGYRCRPNREVLCGDWTTPCGIDRSKLDCPGLLIGPGMEIPCDATLGPAVIDYLGAGRPQRLQPHHLPRRPHDIARPVRARARRMSRPWLHGSLECDKFPWDSQRLGFTPSRVDARGSSPPCPTCPFLAAERKLT